MCGQLSVTQHSGRNIVFRAAGLQTEDEARPSDRPPPPQSLLLLLLSPSSSSSVPPPPQSLLLFLSPSSSSSPLSLSLTVGGLSAVDGEVVRGPPSHGGLGAHHRLLILHGDPDAGRDLRPAGRHTNTRTHTVTVTTPSITTHRGRGESSEESEE